MMESYPGIENTQMFATLRSCMTDRVPKRFENEFDYPDGSKGFFELLFEPIPEGVFILSTDITERKRSEETIHRMERQLRQAQKMDAIGQLAGGVAHDFNNILSVILTLSSLAIEALEHDAATRRDVQEIMKAGERGAALTRQLLSFSRQQIFETSVIEVNQTIQSMEYILKKLTGEHIHFKSPSTKAGRNHVLMDAGQFEQILMNLVLNARDAMLQGGSLTIETDQIYLNGEYTSQHLGVEQGAYVMLAVSDTGVGMDAETQSRIFEPFFTTKEKGKGTGLGLSTVYGIVKQNRGHIWVYSEPGHGTTFKVYLPEHVYEGASQRPFPDVSDLTGTETILLVEDDDHVRAAARGILQKGGYTVIEAKTAAEALLEHDRCRQKIHLLLTDVVMPEMNGVQLARALSGRNPKAKILFMSGYTDEAAVKNGMMELGVAFLQKPLTPHGLLLKIRQVLEAPR
jgi:signal transduction histidine kinase